MIEVTFVPEKQVPKRKGNIWLDNILLKPGVNEVDSSITKHFAWDKLLKLGAVETRKEKVKTRSTRKAKVEEPQDKE